MALIDAGSPASTDNLLQYWKDELKNRQTHQFEINKAVLKLARNEKESYTLDTGQTTVTVRRHNLPELLKQLAGLTREIQYIAGIIAELENAGVSRFVQVRPY